MGAVELDAVGGSLDVDGSLGSGGLESVGSATGGSPLSIGAVVVVPGGDSVPVGLLGRVLLAVGLVVFVPLGDEAEGSVVFVGPVVVLETLVVVLETLAAAPSEAVGAELPTGPSLAPSLELEQAKLPNPSTRPEANSGNTI